MTTKFWTIAAMVAVTLGSCTGKEKSESGKSAEELMAEYAGRRETMPVQTFTFKGDSSATFSSKSGLLVYVPADAFVDDSGKYFGGTITLKLKEAVRAEEWMNFGLETLAEGKPVFCAGMFHFSAEGGGRPLKLAEGAYLRLSVPQPPKSTASRQAHAFRWAANNNDYRLFLGAETSEGVAWRPTDAEVYAESVDFDKLKNDYAVVARWVKMVREQRKNPKPKAFASVEELTRHSFSWDKAAFTQHWIGNKLYGDVHTFAVSEPVRKALSVSGPPVGNFNFAVTARGGKGAAATRNAKAGSASARIPIYDLTDRFKAAWELVCGYEAAAGFAQLKSAFGPGERVEVKITQTGWVALYKPLSAQAVEFKGKILAADGKPADYARIHLLAPGVHLYRHVRGGDYSLLYPAGESFKLIAVQDQKTAQTDAAFKMAGDAVPDLKLPQ